MILHVNDDILKYDLKIHDHEAKYNRQIENISIIHIFFTLMYILSGFDERDRKITQTDCIIIIDICNKEGILLDYWVKNEFNIEAGIHYLP